MKPNNPLNPFDFETTADAPGETTWRTLGLARGGKEIEFDRLKEQLLAEKLFLAKTSKEFAPLRRTADEAAALAWSLGFPLLLFPELFDEKVTDLKRQLKQQKRIRARAAKPSLD